MREITPWEVAADLPSIPFNVLVPEVAEVEVEVEVVVAAAEVDP